MGTYAADPTTLSIGLLLARVVSNGIELTVMYAAGALGLALTGFGAYSLDAWLGIAGRWPATFIWLALTAGIVGGFANLALRRRPAVAAQT